MGKKHTSANKKLWDNLTRAHVKSKFYDVESFVKGKTSLNPIELNLLGRVDGKSVLHLQCHFGMDTLSLARLGASVTGVDFSKVAIEEARKLNERLGLNAKFVISDVNTLDEHLRGKFDIIFASYGVLGWHSDLERWACIVSHFLKDDGVFCLAEFHPVLWMLDDKQSGIEYSYFKKAPIVALDAKSYADAESGGMGMSYCWNHSLAEVFAALESAGLNVRDFKEYDYSPFNIFANAIASGGNYYIKGIKGIVPLVYSLTAKKLKRSRL